VTTIEALPGYWVADRDEKLAKFYADEVRANRPFLGATVKHGGETFCIVSIDRSGVVGKPNLWRIGLGLTEPEIRTVNTVRWKDCSWT
jgi:hypothetical protein